MNQLHKPTWFLIAKQYYYQDNFSVAKQILQTNQMYPESYLLLIRCLADQGYSQEAAQHCRLALTATDDLNVRREIDLRYAFLQIYLDGEPQIAIETGNALLASTQTEGNWLTAVAQDLTARAKVASVTWGLESDNTLLDSAQQLASAAETYQQLEFWAEAYTARIKQGQTLLMMSPSERRQAVRLFQHIQKQAQESEHLKFVADATLRLAELAFDDALGNLLSDVAPNYPALYEKALDLYEQVNNRLGLADVYQSLGDRLVQAGFDGSQYLQQALGIYSEQDNLSGMSRSFTQLAIYHVQQGNLTAGLDYHKKNIAIAQKMGFKLAEASAQMGLGDVYFRTGDYARALAAYEQAEILTRSPIMHGMISLNLANTYTLMNLPERAEPACRTAIAKLAFGKPNANLSLAYFILGNILSSKGDWPTALTAWRDGLTIDEALGNIHSQAEKLQSIAQATLLQHYQGQGSMISEMAYQESMSIFDDAFTRLEPLNDNKAAALKANIRQMQGQTTVTAQQYEDAESYLLQARNQYAKLQMGMQTATTDVMLGLLYYDVANKGQRELYNSAIAYYQRALTYYQSVNMRDQMWPVHYYLAHSYFKRGLFSHFPDEQQADWKQAHKILQQAADIVDFLRGRFAQTNQLAQEKARVSLVANKEKLYRFAIQLTKVYLKENVTAFNWLQRYKGRAFLDALTITRLHTPTINDELFYQKERALLDALNQEMNQAAAIDILEKLHQIWERMATAGLEEYVTLRRGTPVQWVEMGTLLSD